MNGEKKDEQDVQDIQNTDTRYKHILLHLDKKEQKDHYISNTVLMIIIDLPFKYNSCL